MLQKNKLPIFSLVVHSFLSICLNATGTFFRHDTSTITLYQVKYLDRLTQVSINALRKWTIWKIIDRNFMTLNATNK